MRAAALGWLPKPTLPLPPLVQWALHEDQRAWGLDQGEIIPRSQGVQQSPGPGEHEGSKLLREDFTVATPDAGRTDRGVLCLDLPYRIPGGWDSQAAVSRKTMNPTDIPSATLARETPQKRTASFLSPQGKVLWSKLRSQFVEMACGCPGVSQALAQPAWPRPHPPAWASTAHSGRRCLHRLLTLHSRPSRGPAGVRTWAQGGAQ